MGAETTSDAHGLMRPVDEGGTVLFGVIYTPRHWNGSAGAGLQLFTDWQPPLEFTGHWSFATGGGMGLIEAGTSAELAELMAPFTPFFDVRLEQVEGAEGGAPVVPVAAAYGAAA